MNLAPARRGSGPRGSCRDDEVERERLRLVYVAAVPSVGANLVMGLVAGAALAESSGDRVAATFFLSMVLVGLIRIGNLIAWRRRAPDAPRCAYWMARYVATLALNSAVWVGFIATIMRSDDQGVLLLGTVLVLGNTSGALLNTVKRRIFYVYVGPQMVALAVALWFHPSLPHTAALSLLTLVYGGYLGVMTQALSAAINRGLEAGYENRRLQSTIAEARAAQARAVARIETEIQQHLHAAERVNTLSHHLQRHHIEAEQFESVFVGLGMRLASVPLEQLDAQIDAALAVIGESFDVDCVSLCEFEDGGEVVRVSHLWHSAEFAPAPICAGQDLREALPVLRDAARHRRQVVIRRMDTLRGMAPVDHGVLAAAGVRALMTLPVGDEAGARGTIGVATVRRDEDWSPEIVRRVQALGDLLLNAVAQRLTRRALQRSERLFEALFTQFLFGAAIVYPDGRLYRLNQRFRGIFGLPPGFGDETLWIDGFAQRLGVEDGATLSADLTEVADGRRRVIHRELTYRGAETADSVVRTTLFGIYGRERTPIFVALIAEDVTAQRRLQQRVDTMSRELELHQRVMLMGELSASMAHELNQPLTAIVNNAEYLKVRAAARERGDGDPKALIDEVCDDVIGDAIRAGEILRRIRALTRGEHIKTHEVDVNLLIEQVLEIMHSELVIRQAQVNVEPAPADLRFDGDPVQMQQVLINLIVNSLEAGSARLDEATEITIAVAPIDIDRFRIAVCDNGPGLPGGDTRRLFDAFQTSKAGGMGMGLAIVRGIIERHGGTISADNVPDGGARFEIVLPVSPHPAARDGTGS